MESSRQSLVYTYLQSIDILENLVEQLSSKRFRLHERTIRAGPGF